MNKAPSSSEQTRTKVTGNKQMKVKDLVITSMFTAIICILAQISFPTVPIPFTLALFAIFLTGSLLQPKYAFLSVLTYILLGAFGAPVFAGFEGGFHTLTGMTGGYLMAYPLMAFITALFCHNRKKGRVIYAAIGMLISLLLCYFLGTLWFSYVAETNFYYALSICVFPFVLFDIFKIVLAIFVSSIIRKTLWHLI
ncbi:MAG: biotin transporter BioY [Clostridiales bacterium]|nr:biotin transporter BioY [Clostridiales bacterium]